MEELSLFERVVAADVVERQEDRRERTQREKDRRNGTVALTPELAAVTPSRSPSEDYIEREVMWACLREIGYLAGLCFLLRGWGGYTTDEIADGLGLTHAQVRYVIDKGRKFAEHLK